jgi:hypothetical protein
MIRTTKTNSIRIRILILLVVSTLILLFANYSHLVSSASNPQKKRSQTSKQKPNYTKFSHNVPKHQMTCNNCHRFPTANWNKVRQSENAFPDVTDYPKHESCLNCHRQQFFKGTPPRICTICHTNPSPRDSSRHPFPNPPEIFAASKKGQTATSDFRINFPHATHQDLFGFNKSNESRFVKASFKRVPADESCATCHKTYQPQGDSDDEYVTKPPKDLGDGFWLKKGTFKTMQANHATCFTCHLQEGDIKPLSGDCATCHKLDTKLSQTDFSQDAAKKMAISDRLILKTWARRDSSATFRHEWFSHVELACATCHNTVTMNTTDNATLKIRVLSCGGDGSSCHITPTLADGGVLNAEIEQRKENPQSLCLKCHIGYTNAQIPPSHLSAITEITKK